jgi:hypothetical protein
VLVLGNVDVSFAAK